MFLFSFDAFAGSDKVFVYQPHIEPETKKKLGFKAGDLVRLDWKYFLCLWEKIAFQEKYSYVWKSEWSVEKIYASLLSDKTLDLVHWMVRKYFSTYMVILKSFFNFEISDLLKRKVKTPTKKQCKEQYLYLFPDVWTLMNSVATKTLDDVNSVFLHSKMTQKQKDIARWKIKTGAIQKVFCTHGEMFQDWKCLKKVEVIDAHKRYYKNQRDPRYNANSIVGRFLL